MAFQSLDVDPDRVFDVWQVHGDQVVCADEPRASGAAHQKADAILTNCYDLILLMLFADCVPILLYDPVQKVAGVAHAGWKGTVLKTAAKAVETMTAHYGSRPKDILAAIGPSIGPDHYGVGNDVIRAVKGSFGLMADQFLHEIHGRVRFDLWECNRYILEKIGVKSIEVAGLCTACHLDDWFSHRAEQGKTGRFGVLIGLQA